MDCVAPTHLKGGGGGGGGQSISDLEQILGGRKGGSLFRLARCPRNSSITAVVA